MKTLEIPPDSFDQHTAIVGMTGSGKTTAAKVCVEMMLDLDRQVCIIDPTSAWWGLRLKRDGKTPGYKIPLLGGPHGDLPLSERTGAAVARLVTEQGSNVIIDTSGFTVGEYTRWFIDFAETLYSTISAPLHFVIDEAHQFMPQVGAKYSPQTAKMVHVGNRLVSGGRSRGLRVMMISQRPAKLHKDSLTCASTLIAKRVIAPQDRGAIKDWIDGVGDPEQAKEVLSTLASLDKKEGWIWFPEGGYLDRVSFPPIKTYDSSKAPEHGKQNRVKPADIDLSELKKTMSEAVAEAEANDPKILRAKIAELQSQIKKPAVVASAPKIETRIVEVPALTAKECKVIDDATKAFRQLDDRINRFHESIRNGPVGKIYTEINSIYARLLNPPVSSSFKDRVVRAVNAFNATTSGSVKPNGRKPIDVGLSGPEKRIVDALAWWESIDVFHPSREAVAAVARYAPNSGAFKNPMGSLRAKGLIEYPSGGFVRLTDRGRETSVYPKAAPTLSDLHQRALSVLSGPEQKILITLLSSPLVEMTREAVASQSGYDVNSGAFKNPIGRLRSIGFVEYPSAGMAQASSILFPAKLMSS